MPNHFHAIVINVGADPRVRPGNDDWNNKSLANENVNAAEINVEQLLSGSNLHERERVGLTENINAPEINAEQLLFGSALDEGEHAGSAENINAPEINVEQLLFGSALDEGEHVGSPLHSVVQWFKTMSTNEYIRNVKQNQWTPFNGKLWQRNYYEHIIRNEKSFQRIAEYIYNNPVNWEKDKFFTR